MLDEITPCNFVRELQPLWDRLDQATRNGIQRLSAAAKADALLSDDVASKQLLDLLANARFREGLPLVVFNETSFAQKDEPVRACIGICENSFVARETAAIHFAAGVTNSPAYDQAYERLWLRLDLRNEPMFGAEMPAMPELDLPPGPRVPGV